MLRPLFEAGDDAALQAAIASVIEQVTPTIRRLLAGHVHPRGELQPADAEEVRSSVALRLVRKLRACAQGVEDPIERLPAYVAQQTANAIHDVLRTRFPARRRLKSRLRYVLEHDSRVGLWTTQAGPTAGLARFRDMSPVPLETPIARSMATRAMLDDRHPADAIFEVLTLIGRPVLFEVVVRTFAELWNVTDAPALSFDDSSVAEPGPDPHERVETRQYLQKVWSEIRELREQQRAALLLNLRDVGGANGLALFIFAGVSTLEEIARALNVSKARLAELWRDLPLDDLTIARMLGLERQQVINLRKSARTRLLRRMSLDQRKLNQ